MRTSPRILASWAVLLVAAVALAGVVGCGQEQAAVPNPDGRVLTEYLTDVRAQHDQALSALKEREDGGPALTYEDPNASMAYHAKLLLRLYQQFSRGLESDVFNPSSLPRSVEHLALRVFAREMEDVQAEYYSALQASVRRWPGNSVKQLDIEGEAAKRREKETKSVSTAYAVWRQSVISEALRTDTQLPAWVTEETTIGTVIY